jgi:hypothetical protein
MKLGVRSVLLAVVAAAAVDASSSTTADDTVALAPDGKQPRAAVGGRLVAVAYGQGEEIFCRVSRDQGASYSEPTRVGRVDKLMLGMRRGPQVAVSRTGIVVTAVGREEGDVLSWRSTDAGRTWAGPVKVNDQARSAREGLQSLAADANDGVHLVWLDLRDAHTKVFGATSRDGGASWGGNRLVYESPEGTVCECCQPTVAADSDAHVAVMWRNSLSGARDMYITRSNDAGRTFGAAEKLGRSTWPLRACPMDGGSVAVAGGRVATVFRREDVVYAAALGSEEQPIGKGKNAAVAVASDGTYLAWQTLDGNVLLKAPDSAVAVVGPGRFPVLAAAPGGDARVVLTWEDPERGAMVRTIWMPRPTPTQ